MLSDLFLSTCNLGFYLELTIFSSVVNKYTYHPSGSLIKVNTVMIQSFRKDRSGQTVQTQIRLLLEEQSDPGLHCLLFHLHVFNEIP